MLGIFIEISTSFKTPGTAERQLAKAVNTTLKKSFKEAINDQSKDFKRIGALWRAPV